MVHHKICPLCSSDRISLHLRCTDYFVSKEVFDVYKCSACSMEFTQDQPDVTEAGRYYESDDYISHSDTSKGLSNKLYHVVRNIMLHRKRDLIKKITGLNKGCLLDIGCGTGHFAGTMKNAGWQVKGIEINKKARDFAITQFGVDVTGPDKISGMEVAGFDCITLWHVLEHFHDPFKYAVDILHLLKPGGRCVVALPNCSSYDAKYYGSYWAAYDVPRHLWHFNPSSFAFFSEKQGFKLEEIRTLPFDVFYISSISEKYKGSMMSFTIGMIKASFFAFKSVFNRKSSSSVIYILRKP